MATRAELVLLPVDSPFGRGVTVPAYRRPECAEVGSPAYFFDHRYLCQQAGITGLRDFRKQESKRGVYERIAREWTMHTWELILNTDSGRHLPTLMSSRYTLAWLAERWAMSIHASRRCSSEYNANWNRLLESVACTVAAAISRPEVSGVTTITAADVTLIVGPEAEIDMRPLVRRWSQFVDDWDELASEPRHHLPPLVVSQVPLVALFKFVEIRRRATYVPHGHPLSALRHATMAIICFFLETAVELGIDDAKRHMPPPIELVAEGGRVRCHHRPLAKMVSLQAATSLHGSRECFMKAKGETNGTNSALRAATLQLYTDAMQQAMRDAGAWHVSWDGSCHGGKSMLVGTILNCDMDSIAVLRPTAESISIFRFD